MISAYNETIIQVKVVLISTLIILSEGPCLEVCWKMLLLYNNTKPAIPNLT